ncbi:hypothetical protein RHMOL_Rhmol13G0149600 [Rhododendron molle]|uniref:Uncharacterized protein n=1 Tax=Rhododendron molle TaxID=49168 RepID=A0ACC0L7C2_RHOML|nr:hypothetical protein RHMOL_Rhmol13G0149600 [Rhododendron molle]
MILCWEEEKKDDACRTRRYVNIFLQQKRCQISIALQRNITTQICIILTCGK